MALDVVEPAAGIVLVLACDFRFCKEAALSLIARLAQGIDVVLRAREQLSQRAQVILEVLDGRAYSFELPEGSARVVSGVGGVRGQRSALIGRLRDDGEPALDLGDFRMHPGERVSG